MRPIKFRGKRIDNGEWAYGYYSMWQGEHKIFPEIPMGRIRTVDPTTVGQFTGLFDKNGKEVYEHDIVLWKHIDSKGVVYYNESEVHYYVKPIQGADKTESYLDSTHMEVIGNIHDKTYEQ